MIFNKHSHKTNNYFKKRNVIKNAINAVNNAMAIKLRAKE